MVTLKDTSGLTLRGAALACSALAHAASLAVVIALIPSARRVEPARGEFALLFEPLKPALPAAVPADPGEPSTAEQPQPEPANLPAPPEPAPQPPLELASVPEPAAPARSRPMPRVRSKPRLAASRAQPAPASEPAPAPAVPEVAQVSASWRAALALWVQAHQAYPAAAQRNAEQGTATIRFIVARDGAVLAVALVRSSGSAILDEAAQSVFRGARVPAFTADMPQAQTTVTVPIRYRLEG